ncbi:MAG TPA: PaaI family thioesterase [Candidatus Binatia bacterium]|jgi:uncharacterized protein (TIGR00369 family)|nr:PaaI family thioesterase [Candidatus Binatia bacterium]
MDRIAELSQRFAQEPLAAFFGLELVALSPGNARIALLVRPEHAIVGGAAQGGVTTMLADYAGVYAAMGLIPAGHTPAKHIAIDLLRPVGVGETVTATAEVTEQTRSSIFVAVRVADEGGRAKAIASISFAKPKP